jgi:hypothetical protein
VALFLGQVVERSSRIALGSCALHIIAVPSAGRESGMVRNTCSMPCSSSRLATMTMMVAPL